MNHNFPAPELVTERLLLRQWTENDLPLFASMNADPHVMRYFPSCLTREESDALATKLQNELQENPYGMWAVEVVGICPFIGFVGLHEVTFEAHFTPCIEIGWRLAHEHWRKGYAYEAAQRVVKYAFETLKLPEIVALTAVENTRSQHLMEKLKMHRNPQDDFMHPNVPDGNPVKPHVLYRLELPSA